MAKPTYYPDWATQDTTLPATGQTNKVRPRQTIREIGWDKGQIPTAEELNWTLNNNGLWIHYLVDEFMPTVASTYLPRNGTAISFSGDLAGTISWSGGTTGTGSIQVVDNSHNHVSANITDATASPTANMIVRRGSQGDAGFGRVIYGYASANNNFDYMFIDQTTGGQTGGIAWDRAGSVIALYSGPGGARTSGVYVNNAGYVEIKNPRSNTAQEGLANSLVRFDWLNGQINGVNGTITNVNSDLQNYKNAAANTFVQDIRLGTRTTIRVGGTMITFPAGCVATSACGDSDSDIQAQYAPIQKNVNGGWYTVSG